eukprot:353438-Chlamydomonas_euryale.AAC.15
MPAAGHAGCHMNGTTDRKCVRANLPCPARNQHRSHLPCGAVRSEPFASARVEDLGAHLAGQMVNAVNQSDALRTRLRAEVHDTAAHYQQVMVRLIARCQAQLL